MASKLTSLARLFGLVLGLVLLLYPLLVFYGLAHFGPRLLAGLLLALSLGKLAFNRWLKLPMGNTSWLLLAASLATIITLVSGSALGLKSYPVLVNLVLLSVFGFSLWHPPSVIERFARLQYQLQKRELPSHVPAYTRKVTWVWCGFFTLNAFLALATAFASDSLWALYNGLIAYLLMGLLMASEYLVRLRVQRRHQQNQPE